MDMLGVTISPGDIVAYPTNKNGKLKMGIAKCKQIISDDAVKLFKPKRGGGYPERGLARVSSGQR